MRESTTYMYAVRAREPFARAPNVSLTAPAREDVAKAHERRVARAAGADALGERAVGFVGRVEGERAVDGARGFFAFAFREERGGEDGERARRVAVELARAARMGERRLGLAEREMGTGDLHV